MKWYKTLKFQIVVNSIFKHVNDAEFEFNTIELIMFAITKGVLMDSYFRL